MIAVRLELGRFKLARGSEKERALVHFRVKSHEGSSRNFGETDK